MNELLLLALLGGVLWFWYDSLRTRERARAACLSACRRCDVQLLDDTVALERLWPRRDADGRVRLERLYAFEFTDDGMNRRRGSVLLLGHTVEVLHMEPGDLLVP